MKIKMPFYTQRGFQVLVEYRSIIIRRESVITLNPLAARTMYGIIWALATL